MKVEVKNKENKKLIKLPCLMISVVNNSMIILATDRHSSSYEGTVIANPIAGFSLGEHNDIFDRWEFEPFNGSVTLSNEE